MPNRILREGILESERVNSLSPNAELFYRRLMSVVDDFGRHSANPTLLRANCYPLKLDSVKEDSIKKHLTECADAGLIVLYTVAEKTYLEMQDFRQQMRAKDSKYPQPPADAQHLHSGCYADAQHPLSNAHLGGGVDVCEDEDVKYPHPPRASVREADGEKPLPKPAPQSSGRFRMQADWRPSEHLSTLAHQAGLPMPESDEFNAALAEFVAYWLVQDRQRTQHEWDHALLKSLKADSIRKAALPRLTGRHNLSFAERDEQVKRRKWEEMTGKKWPETHEHQHVHSGGVIDVQASLKELPNANS